MIFKIIGGVAVYGLAAFGLAAALSRCRIL